MLLFLLLGLSHVHFAFFSLSDKEKNVVTHFDDVSPVILVNTKRYLQGVDLTKNAFDINVLICLYMLIISL